MVNLSITLCRYLFIRVMQPLLRFWLVATSHHIIQNRTRTHNPNRQNHTGKQRGTRFLCMAL